MKRKELLIIIPAYNEGSNIRKVLTDLKQFSDWADILVINDASTDSTNWIVKEMQYPMISQLFNMGYGCALQTGYKWAIRRNYQYVIQMDGDGQHDVSNIPRLFEKLKEKDEDGRYPDIVLGARFMKDSADFSVSFLKKIVYSMFRFVIRKITGNHISRIRLPGCRDLTGRRFFIIRNTIILTISIRMQIC